MTVLITVGIGFSMAHAETQLTLLNGIWQGGGTDRASPLHPKQQTNCSSTIQADTTSLNDEMTCRGHDGLRRAIRLTVTLNGDKLTGHISQTMTIEGANSVELLEGTVSGQRIEDVANLKLEFPGLVPPVTVALQLDTPSVYSIHASTFGLTLMDLTFNKTTNP